MLVKWFRDLLRRDCNQTLTSTSELMIADDSCRHLPYQKRELRITCLSFGNADLWAHRSRRMFSFNAGKARRRND